MLLVAVGIHALWSYEATPGAATRVESQWPKDSKLQLDPTRPTLVLFLHPNCPCSRATLEELAQIQARAGGKIKTLILPVLPPTAPEQWIHAPLVQAAAAMPNVTIVNDNGAEAARFGAQTSGHVNLYSPAGELLFTGGITGARGHASDNDGRSSVIAAIEGGTSLRRITPVFGCSLMGDSKSEATTCP